MCELLACLPRTAPAHSPAPGHLYPWPSSIYIPLTSLTSLPVCIIKWGCPSTPAPQQAALPQHVPLPWRRTRPSVFYHSPAPAHSPAPCSPATYCPSTQSVSLGGTTHRSSLTFSSRTSSGCNDTGGSMASSAMTCARGGTHARTCCVYKHRKTQKIHV